MKILATVDCDFAGYDPLYSHRCVLNGNFLDDLARTRDLLGEATGGKGLFLIHTSPFVRREHRDLFFTDDAYLAFWKDLVGRGYTLGIHPHEDEPDGSAYYYYYPEHMRKVLTTAQAHLRAPGLTAVAVRCGYCAGNERLFPVLADCGIPCLLDNMGGDFPEVYAHWASAPMRPYRPAPDARTREGDSPVWIVPIAFDEPSGMTGWRALIPEALTEREGRRLWDAVAGAGDGPVTLLIHASAVKIHGEKIKTVLAHIAAYDGEWQSRLNLPSPGGTPR